MRSRTLAQCAALLLAVADTAWAQAPQSSPGASETRRLVFDPAPGLVLGKRIEIEHALETEALTVAAANEAVRELPRVKLATRQAFDADDEYRASSNGRPTLLRRSYGAFDLRVLVFPLGAPEPATDLKAGSAISGKSVVFTWIDEEAQYGRYYDAREGIEEALPSLTEDLDLRALLPARTVGVGDRWDVAPAVLADVLSGGGKMQLVWPEGTEDTVLRIIASGVGGSLFELFGGDVSGTVSLAVESFSRESQTELAHVAVAIELDARSDQTALVRSQMTRGEVIRGAVVSRAQIAYHLSGRATLVWNVSAKHVCSFDLSATQSIDREMVVGAAAEGAGRTEHLRMNGPLRVSLTTGPPRVGSGASASPPVPREPAPEDEERSGDDR